MVAGIGGPVTEEQVRKGRRELGTLAQLGERHGEGEW